jgi:hypothetical protein
MGAGLAGFGFIALVLASVNIFGGFLVTQRMLAMYKKKESEGRTNDHENFAAPAYLVAGVLFIMALRGLSQPRLPAAQGNRYGMIGMAIAVVTTLLLASRHSWDRLIIRASPSAAASARSSPSASR